VAATWNAHRTRRSDARLVKDFDQRRAASQVIAVSPELAILDLSPGAAWLITLLDNAGRILMPATSLRLRKVTRGWGDGQANRGTNTGSVLTRNVFERDSTAKALNDALYD
jgi:hypothetical protein